MSRKPTWRETIQLDAKVAMRFKSDCQQELTVVSVEPWCNRDFFGLRKDGLES
jgi:hypothetical protein